MSSKKIQFQIEVSTKGLPLAVAGNCSLSSDNFVQFFNNTFKREINNNDVTVYEYSPMYGDCVIVNGWSSKYKYAKAIKPLEVVSELYNVKFTKTILMTK